MCVLCAVLCWYYRRDVCIVQTRYKAEDFPHIVRRRRRRSVGDLLKPHTHTRLHINTLYRTTCTHVGDLIKRRKRYHRDLIALIYAFSCSSASALRGADKRTPRAFLCALATIYSRVFSRIYCIVYSLLSIYVRIVPHKCVSINGRLC